MSHSTRRSYAPALMLALVWWNMAKASTSLGCASRNRIVAGVPEWTCEGDEGGGTVEGGRSARGRPAASPSSRRGPAGGQVLRMAVQGEGPIGQVGWTVGQVHRTAGRVGWRVAGQRGSGAGSGAASAERGPAGVAHRSAGRGTGYWPQPTICIHLRTVFTVGWFSSKCLRRMPRAFLKLAQAAARSPSPLQMWARLL